jgi:hypothetical protein
MHDRSVSRLCVASLVAASFADRHAALDSREDWIAQPRELRGFPKGRVVDALWSPAHREQQGTYEVWVYFLLHEPAQVRSFPQTELPPRHLGAVLLYFQDGELDYWEGSHVERGPLDETGTPFFDAPDDL